MEILNPHIEDPCCPICKLPEVEKQCCDENEHCNCNEQWKADYKRYLESLPEDCQQSDEQILRDYKEFKRRVNRIYFNWY